MKVLIVEDNELMRQLLRGVVAPVAEMILECGDGAQACATYQTNQPDWVLMDIELPHLDGIAATRLIKASFPKAKIAMVTEYGDARFRAAAASAGACEFVMKDDLSRLYRVLA